jgi:hypothetical protein
MTEARCPLDIHQGAIVVNTAHFVLKTDDVACIDIDCATKYAKVACYGSGPEVMLCATDHSLHLAADVPRETWTLVRFPDFCGWCVYATTVGRYTVSVVLLRDRHG